MPELKKTVIILLVFLTAVAGFAATSSQAREYLRKARVFFERGNLKDARDYLKRALKIEPESNEIQSFGEQVDAAIEARSGELRRQADFYLEAKNVPEAEKIVRQLLVLNPDDEYGKKQMAAIKKVNEQIEEFQNKGITVNPDSGRSHDVDLYNAISLLNRARGFLANGDRQQALVLVEQVLEREPDYKVALELKEKIVYVNRIQEFIESAQIAFQQGRMRECIYDLDRLIKESPERTEYLLLRARAHLKLKEYSAAHRDFWAYYRQHPDQKKVVFPFLADVYFGMKRYEMAYGFSRDAITNENYRGLSFQYNCKVRFYAIEYGVLVAFTLILPFVIYLAYRRFDHLVNRFPPGKFHDGTGLLWSMLVSGPDKYLPLLIEVARGLNVAWLNYYAGICLLRAGQIEGAQRFLAYSFSNEFLAGRAYFFFGLTRKLLGQEHYDNDFDASIVASTSYRPRGWYPEFVKRIERVCLMTYSKVKDYESYEGMACVLVSDQVGEAV